MILRIPIGAFLLSAENMAAMEELKSDRLLLLSTVNIHEGGIEAAIAYLAEQPTPTLLILESDAQGDALYDQLGRLADVCAPNTFVVLIGAQNDVTLYRNLITEGLSDYLIAPVTAEQLKTSIVDTFTDEDTDTMARVIAFAGNTGGVGSSVLSHNVAHELSEMYDKDVIVVDLDVCYGTAALNFNIQPRSTIVDAMSQVKTMDESVMEQVLVGVTDHLSLLASPASLSLGVSVTLDTLSTNMKVLIKMCDYLVLDVPHLWENWCREILSEADEVVMVSKPDLTNLRNGKNMIEFLGPLRGPDAPTRLVLNQVGAAKRSDLTDKDFKEALAVDPSVVIPYDPEAFGRALNNGEMMTKASKKSKATDAIIELTKLVSGQDEEEEEGEKKSGLAALFKKDKKKKAK